MTRYFIYICTAVLLLAACEREKDLELPDTTVEVLNYDGSPIIQEPNGAVTIDINAQSVAGIENIQD